MTTNLRPSQQLQRRDQLAIHESVVMTNRTHHQLISN
jgi:hypothetical protein